MPAAYLNLTTARASQPDPVALKAQLLAIDPTIGYSNTPDGSSYRLKKNSAWTPAQTASAQNAIDTTSALTPQTAAQNIIDNMPIFEKAIILALIDQLNVIRSKLSPPLSAITTQQALDAVRAKAGTL